MCRNVYRGTAKMFSQDQETLALAKRLIVSTTLCKTATTHIPDVVVTLSLGCQLAAPPWVKR